MMRVLVFVLVSVCINVTLAAPGDELTVTARVANMREGPSTGHPILLKMKKGRRVQEILREGAWVQVATGRDDILSGWIYSTLLSAEHSDDLSLPTDDSVNNAESVFDLFKLALAELNERLKARINFVPFVSARDMGQGHIEVTAADHWLNLSRAERESQLSDVFNIWAAAVGEGRSITVNIVDKNNERFMSMLR